ncbi:type I secretion system permease/ATPase [Salinicola aestuarinus]|uniref:type I secretion system permease/ATPase n=1 Tax=Salinicola aestuarinus TaxID=1949082 RepID=UPI000DA2187F|nr:type I secretion system permease/ATPase [Salinicola aestuarinus]
MNETQPELKKALIECRRSFLFILLFSFFINLLMLAPSIYMLQVYDRVITTQSTETLLMLTLVVVYLFAIMGCLDGVRSRMLVRISNRLDNQLSPRLYQATFRRALATPGTASPQPLSDLTALRQFIGGNALFAFFDAPWIPIYIAILTLFHPLFGLFAAVAGLVLLTVAWINEKSTQGLLDQANREHVLAQELATSNLRNAEVIQAMGMMPALGQRWAHRHQEYLAHQSRASDRAGALTNLSKTLRILFQSLILGLGAYLVIHGSLTGGMMIAGSILMGRALAPIDQMIGSWKGFVGARTAYARLDSLLSTTPSEPARMPLPPPTGAVALDAVIAAPPGARLPTLHDIAFACPAGEHVAIVGPSAAGKSTLARVLLGIWPIQHGAVRLSGTDVAQWPRERLGPHVGYLPQDIELFNGTIAENIARFGDVDPGEVLKAAQKAGVHDMILHQPSGYDTPIQSTGGVLSGGQRQRLGLARALYGAPTLVVLDEPDANLDAAGEQALIDCLRQLKREGTTVFVISHTPMILEHVDRVLTLKEGALVSFAPAVREDVQRAAAQAVARAPSVRMRARGRDEPRPRPPYPETPSQ